MRMRGALLMGLIGTALLAGPAAAADTAKALMRNSKGQNVGTVALTAVPTGTMLRLRLHSLPPGWHAFHVHAVGKCVPPFKSAGGHYNPGKKKHGLLAKAGPHSGDMPNINIGADGRLRAEILNTRLKFSSRLFDADGAAIVIHRGPDDYKSDPAGAAGPRIACGVIKKQ